ncbi:hypothetical protein PO124_32850 [Bacillus licheniformis]|nr:hypothetical protein [Bacillus licheniformis]
MTGVWSVIAFTLCLVIVLLICGRCRRRRFAIVQSIGCSVNRMGGSRRFLALFAQSIAASIEMNLFGVNPESEIRSGL